MKPKVAMSLLGIEVAAGALLIGPILSVAEDPPAGAGNDSIGALGVAMLWGIGLALLGDLLLAALGSAFPKGLP